MAKLIELPTFADDRGKLSVLEDFQVSFKIKRLFYIYDAGQYPRGGHRHKKTIQALICLKGSCEVKNNDNKKQETFKLDNPKKCLILQPEDWHILDNFTEGSILLVLASEYFNENDYIFEDYT